MSGNDGANGGAYRTTDPVARILGRGVLRNGPFGVLGLPVEETDDASIIRAVHEAMAKIDAHPEARTPGADEARLAVHAAAANLLDAGVRTALLIQLGSESSTPAKAKTPSKQSAARSPVSGTSSGSFQLEADILRAIGASGGWGPAARDRFFKLAHARGFDTAAAIASIRGLAGAIGGASIRSRNSERTPAFEAPLHADASVVGRQSTVSGSHGGAHTVGTARLPSSMAESVEPTVRNRGTHVVDGRDFQHGESASDDSMLRAVLIVSSIVVLMVLIAGITMLVIHGDPPETTPGKLPVRTEQLAPRVAVDSREVSEAPAERDRFLDNGPAVVHELEAATEGISVDLEASLAGFSLAVSSLSERWGSFSVPDRVAAQDLIVGYMYGVSGRREQLDDAFEVIAAGLSSLGKEEVPAEADVWRYAWSLGTLVRLRREENLPSGLLRKIDGAVSGGSGRLTPNASSFRAGAVTALRRLGDPLSEAGLQGATVQTWSAWIDSVREASSGESALAESMLIAAIDGRLRHGARTAAGDAEVIAALVGALDWSDGSTARAWLVRSFDDRSIGIDEIHVVTLGLATQSAAGGVNHSMVLPRGAGDYDRRALRDRYRELWAIAENADQGVTIREFLDVALSELSEPIPANGRQDLDALTIIVRTARLNAVAAMLWRAESGPAADLLSALDAPIDAVLGGGTIPDLDGLFTTSGGTWAEEYLSAKSHIQRRLDLLRSALGRGGRLGAMEAEVIVGEALRGSPLRVRDAAAAIVASEVEEPTIVNAVLEAIPLMPKTDRNAGIVELVAGVPLPDIDAGTWDAEARRAVVERLLELIAGHGEYARLDGLSGLLDEAYLDRLGLPGGTTSGASSSGTIADVVAPSDETARSLSARWIASAERRPPAALDGNSIEEILGRRAARLSAADGLVQVFHAEQLCLVEAMAQVIAGEGLGRTDAVGALLASLQQGRSRAQSVLVQIEHTERAMLELWLLRLSGEAG